MNTSPAAEALSTISVIQVHDDPTASPVDAPTQWPLRHFEELLVELIAIADVTKGKEAFRIDLTPYDPDVDGPIPAS